MDKELCKIYKNGKITFYDKESKKNYIFGHIEDKYININVEHTIYYLQNMGQIKVPNPELQFYIELGEKLKQLEK